MSAATALVGHRVGEAVLEVLHGSRSGKVALRYGVARQSVHTDGGTLLAHTVGLRGTDLCH
ncbi:hypothetical protein [Streptomyces sp. NPDC054975]